MNKTGILLTILIVLSIIAVILWALVFIINPNLFSSNGSTNSSGPTISEGEEFGTEEYRVVITEQELIPTEISVNLRNLVIFENITDQSITLSSNSEELELSTIEPGESYHTNLLFNPGEYTYTVVETEKEGRIIVNE